MRGQEGQGEGGPARMARHINRARELRRRQTDAEAVLWARLRARQVAGAKFRRQYPIPPFIVDFCCVERRLIVEVDGGQHATATEEDRARTEHLEALGYRVLRFWNNEVLSQLDAVLEVIARAVSESS